MRGVPRQSKIQNPKSKILILLFLASFLSAPGPHIYAQTAQSQLVVDDQSADPRFPDTVDFTLRAHGFEASRAELNYSLIGDAITSGLQATVDFPTSNLNVKVTLDLATNYIPPGSQVTYYWTLEGDTSEDVYTPKETFTMTDDRHVWQTLSDTQKRVSVHWYQGDQQFGRALRTTAVSALDRLEHDINAQLQRPASIWVYESQDDLLDALPKNIPEWVGGRAFPELYLILAAIPNDEYADDEIRRVVPHELSHLLLNQATQNPYNTPPAWMDEGLAEHNQEVWDPAEEEALQTAAESGKLVPIKALSGSFGATEEDAILSYAESHSVMDFVLNDGRYGPEKFSRTVAAFRKGVTYDDALKEGLGITVDELDQEWSASLPYQRNSSGRTDVTFTGKPLDWSLVGLLVGLGACAGLSVLGALVTLVVILRRRRST